MRQLIVMALLVCAAAAYPPTMPAATLAPTVHTAPVAPEVLFFAPSPHVDAHSAWQPINAFVGTEFDIVDRSRTIELFFLYCIGDDSQGIRELPGEPWHTWQYPQHACFSLVALHCNGRILTGFHLVRDPAFPTGIRLYTAAHVVNFHNITAGSEPGMMDFSACALHLGYQGPELRRIVPAETGLLLQASLSEPHFRNARLREQIFSRAQHNLFDTSAAGVVDIAWFDVSPADASERRLLEHVSLQPWRGPVGDIKEICSVGHDGDRGDRIFRCLENAPTIVADGRLGFRAPTVNGMSGGAVVGLLPNGELRGLGVISSEVHGDETLPLISRNGQSRVLPVRPGNENYAVRY